MFHMTLVAVVAELADATDSKSVAFTGVWVQLPPTAPVIMSLLIREGFVFYFFLQRINTYVIVITI